MNEIFWKSMIEAVKGIAIGAGSGYVVYITLSKEYNLFQFIIGIMMLIFLTHMTLYFANSKLNKK